MSDRKGMIRKHIYEGDFFKVMGKVLNVILPDIKDEKSRANTQKQNKDRKFLELVHQELCHTVDTNTPFDWGDEQKGNLKKALRALIENNCKQSFKNGIEVGMKKAKEKANPWQAKKKKAERSDTEESYEQD